MNLFYGRCSFLIVYFLSISSIFSPIRALSFYNYLWLLLIFIWIIITILDMPAFFGSQTIYMYLTCFFLLYTVSISFLTQNVSLGNRYLEFSQIFIFYFEYKKNILKNQAKNNSKLIIWFMPILILSCILTYRLYLTNPEALRLVGKSKDMGLYYMQMGAGGYNLAYFLVLLIPMLIYMIKQNNQLIIIKKVICLFLIGLFSYVVFISGYFIALMMLLVGFVTLVLPTKINLKTLVVLFLFLPITFLYFNDIILHFLDFILMFSNQLSGGVILKVNEVKNIISGSNLLNNYASSRLDTYLYSIKAFIHYPFLGSIFSAIGEPYSNVIKIGNHSHFIDTFAFFGLGIGLLQLHIYLFPFIKQLKFEGEYNATIFVLMIITIVVLTLNIITVSIGFAIFFILPTLKSYLGDIATYSK